MLQNNNPNAKINPSYLNSVNVSTKLQQQVIMIPDTAKASHMVNKGRSSPRGNNYEFLSEPSYRRNNNNF